MTDDARRKHLDEAVIWAARMQNPDFDDWEEHILWLEEHPSHAFLCERAVSALESGLSTFDRHRSLSRPDAANDRMPQHPASRSRAVWWLGAGAAIAASVAALIMQPPTRAEPDVIFRTQPGTTRFVTLADGTSMMLNGDTAIRARMSNDRQVVLERGEVYLRVAHDSTRPFEVRVGSRVFRDVGTAFNVSADSGVIRLAVAEGAVAVDPEQANVRVDAGKLMTIMGSAARMSTVSARNVGSWRTGRLVYADADLRQVTADLSRSLGVPFSVSPEHGSSRFTGVLTLDRPPAVVARRLAALVGVSAHGTGSGWRLGDDDARRCGPSPSRPC